MNGDRNQEPAARPEPSVVLISSRRDHAGYIAAYEHCAADGARVRLASEYGLDASRPHDIAEAFSRTFPSELQSDAAAGARDAFDGQLPRH